MPHTNETSHARILANFETLTISSEAFEGYAPPRLELKPAQMRASLKMARGLVLGCQQDDWAHGQAVQEREMAYQPLDPLLTRALAVLRSSAAEFDERAAAVIGSIHGHRAVPVESAAAGSIGGWAHVSAPNRSFDARLGDFAQLLPILASSSGYDPADEDLKFSALQAYHEILAVKNSAEFATRVKLAQSRARRDASLDGLAELAADTKAYVLSRYGSGSSEYRSISGLEFRRPQ